MKVRTITSSEYAKIYGCTPTYVNRKLRSNIGMTGMIDWKKSGGTWLIQVLTSWIEK